MSDKKSRTPKEFREVAMRHACDMAKDYNHLLCLTTDGDERIDLTMSVIDAAAFILSAIIISHQDREASKELIAATLTDALDESVKDFDALGVPLQIVSVTEGTPQ